MRLVNRIVCNLSALKSAVRTFSYSYALNTHCNCRELHPNVVHFFSLDFFRQGTRPNVINSTYIYIYISCILKSRIIFLVFRVPVKRRLLPRLFYIMAKFFSKFVLSGENKKRRRRRIRINPYLRSGEKKKRSKRDETEWFPKCECIESRTSSNLLLSQDHGRLPCFIYAIVNIGVILRKVVTPQNHNYVWVLYISRHVRCHASRVASVTA